MGDFLAMILIFEQAKDMLRALSVSRRFRRCLMPALRVYFHGFWNINIVTFLSLWLLRTYRTNGVVPRVASVLPGSPFPGFRIYISREDGYGCLDCLGDVVCGLNRSVRAAFYKQRQRGLNGYFAHTPFTSALPALALAVFCSGLL